MNLGLGLVSWVVNFSTSTQKAVYGRFPDGFFPGKTFPGKLFPG